MAYLRRSVKNILQKSSRSAVHNWIFLVRIGPLKSTVSGNIVKALSISQVHRNHCKIFTFFCFEALIKYLKAKKIYYKKINSWKIWNFWKLFKPKLQSDKKIMTSCILAAARTRNGFNLVDLFIKTELLYFIESCSMSLKCQPSIHSVVRSSAFCQKY